MHLDDAITWFLAAWPYDGPHRPSAATVRTYRQHLRWLLGFAAERGHRYVGDLDADLLRGAFQTLLAPPAGSEAAHAHNWKGGEAAAAGMAAATSALARWLLAQGVPVPDLSMVRAPRPPERIQPRLLSDEFRRLEAAVLHQLIDSSRRDPRLSVSRDLALLYLLGDTGLRADEVVGMCCADVDLEVGRVTVRRGKGGKARALSIVDPGQPRGGETCHLLAEWMTARATIPQAREHDRLWVSLRGHPLSDTELRRVLERLCSDAGLPSSRPPHAFRRAQFTERYRADPANIGVLAARMGWSDRSHHMINVYTRGAELELAAEQQLPSMASQWHAGAYSSSRGVPLVERSTAGAVAANVQAPTRRRPTAPKGGKRLHSTA